MTTSTWKDTLTKSASLLNKSEKDRKNATVLLWTGAKEAVADWLVNSDDDVQGENLYNEAMDALGGKTRKGDASKIKTVALAVKNQGLLLGQYDSLSKAYKAARDLTVVAKQDSDDDAAAEAVIDSLVAPKTATTEASAAKLLLSKGIDGAVVAILDVLNGESGEFNEAASRSFMRAVATEIAARAKAVADAAQAERDKARAQAQAQRDAAKAEAAKKAAAKKAAAKKATKAKPKAGAKTTETPSEDTTPKAKAKPKPKAKAETPSEPEGDDLDDLLDDITDHAGDEVEASKPKPKRKPVRR